MGVTYKKAFWTEVRQRAPQQAQKLCLRLLGGVLPVNSRCFGYWLTSIKKDKQREGINMKKFRCVVCGYIHEGDVPPEICPICDEGSDKFEEVTEEDQ